MIQLFALDPDQQASYAAEIPEHGCGSTFAWSLPHSPLKELAINFDTYLPWLDEHVGDSGGAAVGLAMELSELLGLMLCSPASLDHWNQQALRNRSVWRVVRRNARLLLNEVGWATEIPALSFEQLVRNVRD
jgi:hypothetical protein